MMAMTRSASITPSSSSRSSSLASATEWIGTLRTSMAEGICDLPFVGYDDRTGLAVDRLGNPAERRDRRLPTRTLAEPASCLDLRAHRPAGELAVGSVLAQLPRRHAAERLGLRRLPPDDGRVNVGRDHQPVGVELLGEQGCRV